MISMPREYSLIANEIFVVKVFVSAGKMISTPREQMILTPRERTLIANEIFLLSALYLLVKCLLHRESVVCWLKRYFLLSALYLLAK